MIDRRAILRSLTVILAAPVLTGALAGCGRKGDLEPPPNRDPGHPRSYPAKEKPKDAPESTQGEATTNGAGAGATY